MSNVRQSRQDLPFYVPDQFPAPNNLPAAKVRVNLLGIAALVVGICGLVVAAIPGAIWIGWGFIALAFGLGLVALRRPGKRKGEAVGGLVAALAAIIVAACVSSAVDTTFVSVSFDRDGETSSEITDVENISTENDHNENHSGLASVLTGPEEGSRENPAAIGEMISGPEWDVTVNAFTANADAEVAAANPFNDMPEPGFHYAVVNVQITYKGEDSDLADLFPVAFVAESGKVYWSFDKSAVAPEPSLDGELYAGGSARGNVVLHIPEGDAGLLRLEMGMFGDEVFVAVP